MNFDKKTVQKVLFISLVLIMAGLRILYLVQSQNNPGFRSFMFPDDQEYYHRMAQSVSGGNLLVCDGNITRGTGYIYFLGLLYKLSSNNTIFVRLIQFILGILSGIFLYFIGTRMFGAVVGLVSCALYTFYLPAICYEGALLMTSLITFSMTAGFFCFIKGLRKEKTNYLYLAGFFYGVAFLCRPNSLLPVLFLLGYLLFNRIGGRAVLKFLPLFLLLYGLIICRNYLAGSDLFNITDQGKLVLICGHFHDSEGIGWDRSRMETEIIDKSGDNFFKFVAIIGEDIRTHLSHWVCQQFRKLHAYFFGYEFSQFIDVYLLKETVPMLRYQVVVFGLISPLCLLGLFLLMGGSGQKKNGLLVGYFLLNMVSVVMFYVIARFRQPSIPIICLIASYFLCSIPTILRSGWVRCAGIILLSVVLFWGMNYKSKWRSFHKIFWHISLYNRALLYLEQGDYDKAEEDLKQGMKLDYFASKLPFYFGVICVKRNKIKTALRYFYQARTRGECTPELFKWLGLCHKFLGQYPNAIRFFRRSIDLKPDQLDILNSLADLYLKTGDEKQALNVWILALKRYPSNSSINYNLGCYYAKNNNPEEAYKYFCAVNKIDPNFKNIAVLLKDAREKISNK